MTRRFDFSDEPASADLKSIADVLLAGGVVLLPTDTIYGLHAAAADVRAVERIASIKGRDAEKPFIVIGSSLKQLEKIGIRVGDRVRPVLEELWPGPLTAVVDVSRPAVAAARGAATLAVRVPDLAWLRSLLDLTGPLISTSANRSGAPPMENLEELPAVLRDQLDAIVDAGSLSGKPSVIVDFTGAEPRLIRDGERLFTQKVWKTLRKSL